MQEKTVEGTPGLAKNIQARKHHYSFGGKSKTVAGKTFRLVKESKGRVWVSEDGTLITPLKTDGSYKGTPSRRYGHSTVSIDGWPALVHVVVWEVFNGRIEDGTEIDHVDADPTNNALANLRVVTSEGNSANPITRKRTLSALSISRMKATKARCKPVIGVRLNAVGTVGPFDSARIAEDKTGIPFGAISNSLRGVSKTAGGYVWFTVAAWECVRKEVENV